MSSSDAGEERVRPLIGVIIPAHNAALTIDATLWSVRKQSYSNIDIIVIDDGSTDRTAQIVARHAGSDARVRLIQQENGGVASARNRGIAATQSTLIAPIDADDIWHPTKLEKQLDVLQASGPRVGLVYCWSATIDSQGTVVGFDHRISREGDVVSALCALNFLGNASSALIRREALAEIGGYDAAFHAMDAQGCEDWIAYLHIARTWHFALVKEFLTGYRVVDGNMSSRYLGMWRSHLLAVEHLSRTWPDLAPQLAKSKEVALRGLAKRAVASGDLGVGSPLLLQLAATSPIGAISCLGEIPGTVSRRLVRPRLRHKIKALITGQRRIHGDLRPGDPFPGSQPHADAAPMSGPARLGIVVCTHNRAGDLGHCLSAIAKQVQDPSVAIVVVDSASSPGAAQTIAEICALHPGARLVRLQQPGLSHARNAALSFLKKTDWIAFIDDDARPAAGWLSEIIRAINACHANCAVIAGGVDPLWPATPSPAIDPLWGRLLSLVRFDDEHSPSGLAKFAGANLLFRTSPLLEIGGFDIELGRSGDNLIGGEESLAVRRLLRNGWTIAYIDRIRVWHRIPPDRLSKEWITRRAEQEGVTNALLIMKLQRVYQRPFFLLKACAGMVLYRLALCLRPNRREYYWAYLIRRTMAGTLWARGLGGSATPQGGLLEQPEPAELGVTYPSWDDREG